MNDKNHSLWVEHYRPTTLDTYVGNESLKEKVSRYINSNDMPHLLLYGKAGTGKTTLAKILVNSIDCDNLYINASDENSVDNIRNKVKSFASTVGFAPLKIIILDESDYVTPNAQAALRNLMETFSKTTRFILTCNYIERIIDPVISRCQSFQVIPPSMKEVGQHIVKNILDVEKIEYDLSDIVTLIQSNYPDIRRIINQIQRQVMDGKLVIDKSEVIQNDYKLKIIETLKLQDKKLGFQTIRQILADNKITDFSDLYSLLYNKVGEYADGNIANVILEIAEGQKSDVLVVDKEINAMAALIRILGVM